jgi:hypothetical protein
MALVPDCCNVPDKSLVSVILVPSGGFLSRGPLPGSRVLIYHSCRLEFWYLVLNQKFRHILERHQTANPSNCSLPTIQTESFHESASCRPLRPLTIPVRLSVATTS